MKLVHLIPLGLTAIAFAGLKVDKSKIDIEQKANYLNITENFTVAFDSSSRYENLNGYQYGCQTLSVKIDKEGTLNQLETFNHTSSGDSILPLVFYSSSTTGSSAGLKYYRNEFKLNLDSLKKQNQTLEVKSVCAMSYNREWYYLPIAEDAEVRLLEGDLPLFYDGTPLSSTPILMSDQTTYPLIITTTSKNYLSQTQISSGSLKGNYLDGVISLTKDVYDSLYQSSEVVIWWNWNDPKLYAQTPFSLSSRGEFVYNMGSYLREIIKDYLDYPSSQMGFLHTVLSEGFSKKLALVNSESKEKNSILNYIDSVSSEENLLSYFVEQKSEKGWVPATSITANHEDFFYDNLKISTQLFTDSKGVKRTLILVGDHYYSSKNKVSLDILDSLLGDIEFFPNFDPYPGLSFSETKNFAINPWVYAPGYAPSYGTLDIYPLPVIRPQSVDKVVLQVVDTSIIYADQINRYGSPEVIENRFLHLTNTSLDSSNFKWIFYTANGDSLGQKSYDHSLIDDNQDSLSLIAYSNLVYAKGANQIDISKDMGLYTTGDTLLYLADSNQSSPVDFTSYDPIIMGDKPIPNLSIPLALSESYFINQTFYFNFSLGTQIKIIDADGKVLLSHYAVGEVESIDLSTYLSKGAKFLVVTTLNNQWVKTLR